MGILVTADRAVSNAYAQIQRHPGMAERPRTTAKGQSDVLVSGDKQPAQLVAVKTRPLAELAAPRLASATKAPRSTDDIFRAAGWRVSHRGFDAKSARVLRAFEADREHFVKDTQGTIYSSVAARMVKVQSYDDLRTSRDEMYGDIVFFTDFRTGELMEVRWYEDGKKNLIYSRTFTPSATNSVPMAENALF